VRIEIAALETQFWPQSGTSYFGKACSYEVTTDSEIYRISNNPTDFLGTVDEEWPKDLQEGWNRYKAPEIVMYEVEDDYKAALSLPNPDERVLCRLQRERYILARDAAEARIAFLTKWPNAFEKDGNTESHWHYPKVLIGYANDAQRKASDHCSR
jgi:hypothetical protein